ncbi:precorrin methylase [bacterium]|nr:precorrin methylase [bacterium]
MKVAGLGFRRGVSAESLRAALALVGKADALATAEDKTGEPGLVRLAKELGLNVHGVSRAGLAAQGVEGSAKVMAAYGTGSVAEAAALAMAGRGARLIATRRTGPDGMAVAALAEGDGIA